MGYNPFSTLWQGLQHLRVHVYFNNINTFGQECYKRNKESPRLASNSSRDRSVSSLFHSFFFLPCRLELDRAKNRNGLFRNTCKRMGIDAILEKVANLISSGTEHPKLSKLREVVTSHFEKADDPKASKIIIFTHFRDSVAEVKNSLENLAREKRGNVRWQPSNLSYFFFKNKAPVCAELMLSLFYQAFFFLSLSLAGLHQG